MSDEPKNYPLKGSKLQTMSQYEFEAIKVHRSLLANAREREAVAKKAVEIIEGGPSVKGVHIEPRKSK